MNFEEKRRWGRIRRRGAIHFILVDGGLKLGGSLFLVVTALGVLTYRAPTLKELVGEGLACLVGGLVGGVMLWVLCEMQYWWRS